jgi:catechol 2,3-dioxygenase-like lactoylglutathione lyase family enzyme
MTHPRFGFAILYPKDLQAAKRFYVEVLGLRVEREAPTFVQFDHFALAGDVPLGASGKPELYWLVDDAEAAYRGAPKDSISQPLAAKPFGKVFGMRDPDGETCFVLELAKNRPSRPVA